MPGHSPQIASPLIASPLIASGGRIVLPLARIGVAAAATGLAWGGVPALLVSGSYLFLSTCALLWKGFHRPVFARALLGCDLFYLLLSCWVQRAPVFWVVACLWLVLILVFSLLLHSWRETAAIIVSVSIAGLISPMSFGQVLFIAAALAGVVALVAAWQKERLEDRIYHVSRQSVFYRAESEAAREAERERIAADFHDGPLQSFASAEMRLETLGRLLETRPEDAARELEQLRGFWRAQVGEVRSFVHRIRGEHEGPLNLAAALSELVDAFQRESGVETAFSGTADLGRLSPETGDEILQMVREALHNIHKHAGASTAELHLEDANGALEIRVADNGRGFPFVGKYTLEELDAMQRGPSSIRRRVRRLDGSMTLESETGKGSRLCVRLPV